jgi:hypothetical protein
MQFHLSMVDGKGDRLGAKRRGGRPDADAWGYFLNGRSSLRTLSDRMNGGIGMWISDGLPPERKRLTGQNLVDAEGVEWKTMAFG